MLERVSIKRKILTLFPALRHRNYRYYFSGQLVSLIGTWLQTVAQGWLVLQLTNSAFMVGLISALGFLPVMLFGLFGGVLVDRFEKRKLIIFTQLSQMVLALALGTLVILGYVNVWNLGLLAFLLGVTNAVDMPARQSFTVEMVGQEHLPSAIALNMGTFNSARVIGPAIAGALIALIGTGGAFIINGLSFLAPFIALMLMDVKSDVPEVHPNPLVSIKSGLKYTFKHSYIRSLLFFTAITSIFGWSYATILPVITQNIFHKDASGLGIIYSAAGLGAVAGTIFISAFHKKFDTERLILGGSFIFVISIFLFSLTDNFYLSLPILFFAGIGLAIQMAMINSTIQFHVKHNFRGRVMSIYSLFFIGMQPLGSLQIGYMTEKFGSHFAISLGAVILFLSALYMHFTLPKLHQKAMAIPGTN